MNRQYLSIYMRCYQYTGESMINKESQIAFLVQNLFPE